MTAPIASLTNLDYALNYARDWKWAVMPLHSIASDGFCTCGNASCKSEGKHPRTPNGLKDASKDEAQINAWWAQWPDANVGIATGQVSGIVVLDVDAAKGAHSADLLFGDVDATALSLTPKVKTGGGLHFYYKYPAGVDIRNSASKLGKFIDVRGEGGYVVAPPSKHISGKTYEFLNVVDELAEFPAEWIAKLKAPAVHAASSNGAAAPATNGSSPFVVPPPASTLTLPDEINQGQRNVELTKLAGSLRRIGLSENAIFSALAIENQRICKPPIGDDELHHIARSVARYSPQDVLNQVSDANPADPNADYENTLKPYLFGDFLRQQFEEKEVLGFHIGKRDIAIIQAATNAGKTTLLRNIGLCMAAGRPFMPFYEAPRPVKIAYFDFENDAQDVQRDLKQMFAVFTTAEVKLLEQNYIVIPKGLMDGELFQFNTHEKWANALIQQNQVEFIIVDNVSAAYDLNDENSNAEVTKKVIKPLLKMAYKGNCAFLFAHHYGKAKTELDHAGVHAGRGASALQALSRTVINMFGDVSKGEPVTVECAKRKTDGGQNYREVFKLEADRWFHHTTIVAPPKKHSCSDALNEYINDNIHYPDTVTPADLDDAFQGQFGIDSINKTLASLASSGRIAKHGRGEYCSRQKKSVSQVPPPKNFYDKDDDD